MSPTSNTLPNFTASIEDFYYAGKSEFSDRDPTPQDQGNIGKKWYNCSKCTTWIMGDQGWFKDPDHGAHC